MPNSTGVCLLSSYCQKARAYLLVGPVSVSWLLCVTCHMCLREVRGTAQAGSLALLPTTLRGEGGVGRWEGLRLEVSGQSALSACRGC